MRQKIKWIVVLGCFLLTGCTTQSTTGAITQTVESGYIKAERGNYDSFDTAIVVKKIDGTDSITLCNIETGKNYTLSYNMETTITNQYDEVIAMSQIAVGDIVDVTFMREQKWLNTITISPSAWSYTNVSNYDIDESFESIQVANEIYKLYDEVVAAASGVEIALLDLHEMDILTLKGIDQTVYSMSVEQGHGYLRLESADYYVGGWLEVGKEIICQITDSTMLITVPEGTYDIHVSNGGISGTKEITVAQKQEVRVDVSEFNGDSTSVGQVVFIITPADAVVTIDGVEVDVSQVLEYEYGVHQMIIEADGYQTITQFVKVGAPSASISIAMELLEEEDDTVSSNSLTSDEVLDTSLDGYVVRIEGPTGAQVYVDSVYVGVAPISFPKVEGEHSLILAMEGYETRTYTIQIDGEEKDVAFAFSELTLSE